MGDSITHEPLEVCPLCGGRIQATVKQYVDVDLAHAWKNGSYFELEMKEWVNAGLMPDEYPPTADEVSIYCENDHTEEQMLDKMNEGR